MYDMAFGDVGDWVTERIITPCSWFHAGGFVPLLFKLWYLVQVQTHPHSSVHT